MSAQRKCGRCGKAIEEGMKHCPYCGAPREGNGRNGPHGQAGQHGGMPGYIKLLMALLLVAVLTLGALLVLLLERDKPRGGQEEEVSSAMLLEELATVAPSPTPAEKTPVPMAEEIVGMWVATRIETNSKKSKEILIDTVLGDHRTVILFLPDQTAAILLDQMAGAGPEANTRNWYAEGQDVFIDKGEEVIGEGVTMFGRTRFFMKDRLLYSTYTLDGKEVGDYIVYTRSETPTPLPVPAPMFGDGEEGEGTGIL